MFKSGFYAITNSEIAESRGMTLMEQARELLEGGAVALQYRDKVFEKEQGCNPALTELSKKSPGIFSGVSCVNNSSEFFENAKKLKKICEEYEVPFIINDRYDVAAKLGVMVHLGQEDLVAVGMEQDAILLQREGMDQDAILLQREQSCFNGSSNGRVEMEQGCSPALTVEGDIVGVGLHKVGAGLYPASSKLKFGISTHSLAQAIEAENMGASYIGIGPVYGTPTKPTYKPIGVEIVKQVVDAVKIPVVAIGGLDMENVSSLASLGVKNCAMVRSALQAEDVAGFVRGVNERLAG